MVPLYLTDFWNLSFTYTEWVNHKCLQEQLQLIFSRVDRRGATGIDFKVSLFESWDKRAKLTFLPGGPEYRIEWLDFKLEVKNFVQLDVVVVIDAQSIQESEHVMCALVMSARLTVTLAAPKQSAFLLNPIQN